MRLKNFKITLVRKIMSIPGAMSKVMGRIISGFFIFVSALASTDLDTMEITQ